MKTKNQKKKQKKEPGKKPVKNQGKNQNEKQSKEPNKELGKNKDKILVTLGNTKTLIDKNDIMMMITDSGGTNITLKCKSTCFSSKSLTKCCELIDKDFIWHFGKQKAINIHHFVKFYEKMSIELTNNTIIDLTICEVKAFKKLLHENFDSL